MQTNLFDEKKFQSGRYYLIERDTVEQIYEEAGYSEEDDLPNFLVVNDKECLFTENYIEKDGKEYEVVMIAEGFSWGDIHVYEEEHNHAHNH
jgi:hypothetical protein